jgi:hypothetical protein
MSQQRYSANDRRKDFIINHKESEHQRESNLDRLIYSFYALPIKLTGHASIFTEMPFYKINQFVFFASIQVFAVILPMYKIINTE